MKKTLMFLGTLLTLTSCQALQQIAAELNAGMSGGGASYSSSSSSSEGGSSIFGGYSSSDEDTTIAYREQKENKSFAFSRLGQKHTYYINIPDTEDYELKNGRIEFQTYKYNDRPHLRYNIKGIFFNKSEYKYYLEILLNGYLADGTSKVKHKIRFELSAENRHDIKTKSYNTYRGSDEYESMYGDLERALPNIDLDGNKIIFPITDSYRDGVVIKLYKNDKLVYTGKGK